MPNIFNYLKHPEYVFRPQQVLRRLRRILKAPQQEEIIRLPWGARVKVRPNENIGSDIFHYGIFDRVVPEAICRLLDGNETAVEVGANIGQNFSLMAFQTTPAGRAIAFEPHPEIFEELKNNSSLWPEKVRQNLRLENFALGETTGEAWLTNGVEFEHNRGSAALARTSDNNLGFRVNLRTLDDYMQENDKIGVCKIDVEGHELSVLKGAERTLSRHAIRDIIFEDFCPMMSPVALLLQAHHYRVFALVAGWWKPMLTEASEGARRQKGFSFNYLATLDPERAQKRFKAGGWHCLNYRRRPS